MILFIALFTAPRPFGLSLMSLEALQNFQEDVKVVIRAVLTEHNHIWSGNLYIGVDDVFATLMLSLGSFM